MLDFVIEEIIVLFEEKKIGFLISSKSDDAHPHNFISLSVTSFKK